jgi:hypothetical protein
MCQKRIEGSNPSVSANEEAAARRLFCRHRGERGPALSLYSEALDEEDTMPKGEQRSNKMTKKPKKDSAPLKEVSAVSSRPTPPTTLVMPKGKLKNKPA